MPFNEDSNLKYFQFTSFQLPTISHGVFTRVGGVSPSPWDTLNVGGVNGDQKVNIIENRQRIFNTFSRPIESLYDVWQIHSSDVICTNIPRGLDAIPLKADAIITNNQNVTLFMRFGDCVPILFYDPINQVVGLAHAGWKGTVKKIADRVIKTMQKNFGSLPKDILAGIGPSIGAHHYEVGKDVIDVVKDAFPNVCDELLLNINDGICFDLWKANQIILEEAGVNNIEISGICTACNVTDWYSHRGEKKNTGRFGALIGLCNQ